MCIGSRAESGMVAHVAHPRQVGGRGAFELQEVSSKARGPQYLLEPWSVQGFFLHLLTYL